MSAPDFPPGAPCWIELGTNDADRIRDFYPALFGWTAGESAPEFGGYFMFMRDGVPIAGAMPLPAEMHLPDAWGIYLSVDDARKTVDVATSAGASVRVEPMDVADLGTSAVLDDPNGDRIGAWQAASFAGVGSISGAGAPAWFELHTRDFPRSVAFYRDVFGWDVHNVGDTDDFRYSTLGKDGGRAGIMDAARFLDEPGATPGWSIYFGSDDVDATLARVAELGGTVTRPAEDTPYGRLATATDPTGARFKLLGPNTTKPA